MSYEANWEGKLGPIRRPKSPNDEYTKTVQDDRTSFTISQKEQDVIAQANLSQHRYFISPDLSPVACIEVGTGAMHDIALKSLRVIGVIEKDMTIRNKGDSVIELSPSGLQRLLDAGINSPTLNAIREIAKRHRPLESVSLL